MFDDLRQQAGNESAFDEEPQDGGAQPAIKGLGGFTRERSGRRKGGSDIMFGLTGAQRFVLSVLFMFMVIMLGVVILIVTGRVILPL